MEDISTIAELKAWLQAHEIDFEAWGANATTSVANLWAEINTGEARMEANPPRRLVEVARVLIRRDDQILIEVGQEFVNGQTRQRNSPPSEKMRPQETYVAAARRCLTEELGLSPESITIFKERYQRKVREKESESYPGLMTRYVIHVVEATSPGLPEGPFCTKEEASGPGDPVKRHHWEWKPIRK